MLASTGCGEEMIELTEEEKAQIVQFSAHVIGEFNKDQTEGYTPLNKKQLDAIRKGQQEQKPEDPTMVEEDEPEGTGGGTSDNGEKEPTGEISTLTDALGIRGLAAKVTKYKVQKDYVQDDVFAMNAKTGNEFVVLTIELENTTSKKISCDFMKQKPDISLRVNDESLQAALETLLPNDLLNFSGKIGAGKTKKLVLLFEVSEKVTSNIQELKKQLSIH